MSTTEHYEIRQLVKTVNKSWLEIVVSGQSRSFVEQQYSNLVAANPDQYFEFVQVTRTETCLEFFPQTPPLNS